MCIRDRDFTDMYEEHIIYKPYFLSKDKCLHLSHVSCDNKKHFNFSTFDEYSWKIFWCNLRDEREESTGFKVKREIDVLLLKLSMSQKEFFLTVDIKKIGVENHTRLPCTKFYI